MEGRFNGERLKKARIYRGMTVAELAERVDCQRQTLSMYELSKSQPAEGRIVFRLAQALNFPVSYFFQHSEEEQTGTVYFRSLLTTSKKYRIEQNVNMCYLAQIYTMLQDYILFPKFEPLNFPDGISPEDAANALRDAWELGREPIHDIVTVVEDHGILVNSFSTSSDSVDAFSKLVQIENASTFLIAYSSNKTSAARIHFDIAHELGHICLHTWSEDIEELSKEEFKLREMQANNFAAAFLLPADTFGRDASNAFPSLPSYKKLKQKWKVSMAAMLRRSKDLGILSYNDYQNLIKTMQRRGQRKEEPLDDVLETASPSLLKMAVIMLLKENVFTPQEFMRELSSQYNLSIYPEDVESLLMLPTGTLSPPKIIEIPSIRLKNR